MSCYQQLLSTDPTIQLSEVGSSEEPPEADALNPQAFGNRVLGSLTPVPLPIGGSPKQSISSIVGGWVQAYSLP